MAKFEILNLEKGFPDRLGLFGKVVGFKLERLEHKL